MSYVVFWVEEAEVVVDEISRKTLQDALGISKAQLERYIKLLKTHENTKRRFDYRDGQQTFTETQCRMLFALRKIFLSANKGGKGIKGEKRIHEYLNYPGI